MGIFNFFTQEIAMDLGTANTLIIHNEEINLVEDFAVVDTGSDIGIVEIVERIVID